MNKVGILSIVLLSSLAVAHAQDKIDLAEKAAGTAKKYRVTLKIGEDAMDMEMSGVVSSKPTGDPAKKLELELDSTNFKCLVNGQPSEEMTPPTKRSYVVDKRGLPLEMSVQSDQALYTALFIARMRPAQSLAAGDSFKWNWTGASGKGFLKGDGKLVEIVEKDGRKLARLKSTVELQPDDVDHAADVEVESWFDVANGQLVESKMSGKVQDGTFAITVVEQK